MAKRRRRASALDKFAEDLGQVLGAAQNRAEGWLSQQQTIAKQLTQIRDSSAQMLAKLTGGATRAAGAVRRGRRASLASGAMKSGPARRKVSAAARKKMSLAAKKRWAERKAAQKKTEK